MSQKWVLLSRMCIGFIFMCFIWGVEGGIRVEGSFLHVPSLLHILKNVLYVQKMSISLAIDHFYGPVVALAIHTGRCAFIISLFTPGTDHKVLYSQKFPTPGADHTILYSLKMPIFPANEHFYRSVGVLGTHTNLCERMFAATDSSFTCC